MRRMSRALAAVAVSGALLVPTSGVAVAAERVAAAPVVGQGQLSPMQAQAEQQQIRFSCTIPRTSPAPCGPRLTVGPGRIVVAFLGSSGGKRVQFDVRDVTSNAVLGQSGFQPPGTSRNVWQNNTGRSVTVQPFADSEPQFPPVRVQATGHYSIR